MAKTLMASGDAIWITKDKQNFAAVEHLIKASSLLDKISDAVGTKCYLELISCSINSCSYPPKKRLQEIRYATFFLRYWRQWILQQRSLTVKENFITSNCYTCIELNAHSLLAYIIILILSETVSVTYMYLNALHTGLFDLRVVKECINHSEACQAHSRL